MARRVTQAAARVEQRIVMGRFIFSSMQSDKDGDFVPNRPGLENTIGMTCLPDTEQPQIVLLLIFRHFRIELYIS
jgi:hypothetical protein